MFGFGDKGKKPARVDKQSHVADKTDGRPRGQRKSVDHEELEEDITAGGAQLDDDAVLDYADDWEDDAVSITAAELKQIPPYETGLVNPKLAGLPLLNTMTQDETLMSSAMLEHCSRYGMFIGSLSSRTPLATKGSGRLL